MSREDFYQEHLNRVSRSFAYCIGNLAAPLKSWVGLTYLICRVLDTVEDAPWESSDDQQRHFDQFNEFLNQTPKRESVELWVNQFPKGIPEGEKLLLEDSYPLFVDLHDAPDSVHEAIQEMVLSMSRGMKHFAESRKEHGGILRLQSLNEVNHYCFYVAGVVGEALARLLSVVESKFEVTQKRILDAHHFGLFLQKVNLIKDQKMDAAEGREFVFDRDEIYQSMSYNAFGAFRFLSAIPLGQKEFRKFCAWSLFLGLASLPWLEQLHALDSSGKLPREAAEEIFSAVDTLVDDPQKLDEMYRQLIAASQLEDLSEEDYFSEKETVSKSFAWPSKFYHGAMDRSQEISLGF